MKLKPCSRTQIAVLASIAVLAGALGAALAVAAPSKPHQQTAHSSTSASNVGAMSSYPEQAAAFASFRRPATAADEALAENSSVQSYFANHPAAGAQPDQSRVVYQDTNVTLGIFPTTRATPSGTTQSGVCFVVATAEGAIVAAPAPMSEAQAQPLSVRYQNSAGEHLYGVLPDGVHSLSVTVESGDTSQVSATSDGGFAFTSGAAITGWSYLDADGHMQHHTVESPSSWTTMGNP